MSNTLITPEWMTLHTLMVLENTCTLTKFISTNFDKNYEGIAGQKIGPTINIRKPIRPIVTQGPSLGTPQDTVQTSVPLTLNQNPLVALQYTNQELTLDLNSFGENIVAPSAAALSNWIDSLVAQQLVTIPSMVGTPGTTPNVLQTYLDARAELNRAAVPDDGNRSVVINPTFEANIINALAGLFNPQDTIAKQFLYGKMGKAIGLKWSMDQNLASATQTVGNYAGTPTVSGPSQSGSTLVTHGWTASIADLLNIGDRFQIAGVYEVNPQSYAPYKTLKTFVVTAQAASDSGGNSTISISPSIVSSGSGQTVSAAPASGAAITVLGAAGSTYELGVVLHKQALALGCCNLELPRGVDMAQRQFSKRLNLAFNLVRAYDVNAGNFPTRLEALVGATTLYPELACVIAG